MILNRGEEKSSIKERTQIALGLISTKDSIMMGLANASCPMEEYIQFDKNKIGVVLVSDRINEMEPEYP